MKSIRYIHAADLHLDAAFRGILDKNASETLDTQLRSATFTALERLVLLCETEKPDFLVIAGDIYNVEDSSIKAQLCLRDACQRLARSNIPVFLAHGNHDPLSSRLQMITWPKNTFVFGHTVENFPIERDGETVAVVHGISHATSKESNNLTENFSRLASADTEQTERVFQLGVLHCTLDTAKDVDRYAPCSLDDLKKTGLDAWALGHVHERRCVCEEPFVAYSGNTQGLHINENGAKGCLLVTAVPHENAFHTTAVFHPLSPVVWETIEVSVEGIEHVDTLVQRIVAAMEQATGDTHPQCNTLIVRVCLTGRTVLDKTLRTTEDRADLAERIREVPWGSPFVWLKDIIVKTAPVLPMEELLQRKDLLGETLRLARESSLDPDALQTLSQTALALLFEHKRAKNVLEPITEQDLSTLLEEAQYLCADLMENN